MKALENMIRERGVIINNSILKVDSFLNYQIDVKMLREIARFIATHFPKVDKVITVEASGIAFATAVALELGDVPIVFAKKSVTSVTANDDNYTTVVHSFTHNKDNHIYIAKKYIRPNENILIVDDFLAAGNASVGLVDICKQANANIVGVAVAVEKEMQGGRAKLEALGLKVCACARIVDFKDNQAVFSDKEC